MGLLSKLGWGKKNEEPPVAEVIKPPSNLERQAMQPGGFGRDPTSPEERTPRTTDSGDRRYTPPGLRPGDGGSDNSTVNDGRVCGSDYPNHPDMLKSASSRRRRKWGVGLAVLAGILISTGVYYANKKPIDDIVSRAILKVTKPLRDPIKEKQEQGLNDAVDSLPDSIIVSSCPDNMVAYDLKSFRRYEERTAIALEAAGEGEKYKFVVFEIGRYFCNSLRPVAGAMRRFNYSKKGLEGEFLDVVDEFEHGNPSGIRICIPKSILPLPARTPSQHLSFRDGKMEENILSDPMFPVGYYSFGSPYFPIRFLREEENDTE